jgi:hypothetical protein
MGISLEHFVDVGVASGLAFGRNSNADERRM